MATILLVDDDLNILEVTSAILEYGGYKVLRRGNGQEAMAYLQKPGRGGLPDLILSDTMMPVMDGRELCRRVQADPSFSTIPFVLMSAAPGALAQDNLSYSAFVPKPFDALGLLATLEKVLGEKKARC
ncbi:MAG TPA: response regulator [Chloroflexia bacterium]|nr:response regulator [Chloroflexia bacterium]